MKEGLDGLMVRRPFAPVARPNGTDAYLECGSLTSVGLAAAVTSGVAATYLPALAVIGWSLDALALPVGLSPRPWLWQRELVPKVCMGPSAT